MLGGRTFATLRRHRRRRHRGLPSCTHIPSVRRARSYDSFKKSVSYIIVVITNGIIGYGDSVPATEERISCDFYLARC